MLWSRGRVATNIFINMNQEVLLLGYATEGHRCMMSLGDLRQKGINYIDLGGKVSSSHEFQSSQQLCKGFVFKHKEIMVFGQFICVSFLRKQEMNITWCHTTFKHLEVHSIFNWQNVCPFSPSLAKVSH